MTLFRFTREVRADWPRMLENIRKTGMSLEDVAETIGVGRSSVHDYCDDRSIEPAFWVGDSLRALWAERTGLRVEDAPTKTVVSYKVNPVRSAISASDALTQNLLQLSLVWNAPVLPEPAETERRVSLPSSVARFRVGLAFDSSQEGTPACALVVHDEGLAARVQRSPQFIRWLGEWETAAAEVNAYA